MRLKLSWATTDLIGWISKNVILPLAPFLVGALVRWLVQGKVTLTMFDASELAFSMAMLCLLLILSSSKLNDKHLAQSLTNGFSLGIVVFVALFAVAIVFDELNQTQGAQPYTMTLNLIRRTCIAISLVTITLAIMSKHKFKLESFDL